MKAVAALLTLFAFVLCGCPDKDKEVPTGAKPGKKATSAKKAREKLTALPYLNWIPVKTEDGGKSSITLHLKDKTSPGLNFYNSRPRHEALLMNMEGGVLHRWSSDRDQPGLEEKVWSKIWGHFDFAGWHHSELNPDGSVLAIVHYQSLIKLDWNSKVLWSAPVAAHHDLDVATNGDIYVLDAQAIPLTEGGKRRLFLDNGIVVFSPNGERKKRYSLYELFRKAPSTSERIAQLIKASLSVYDETLASGYKTASTLTNPVALSTMAAQLRAILDGKFRGSERTRLMFLTQLHPIDMFHANSLEILRENRPGFWRKGDVLLSLRTLNVVLIVDLVRSRVRWFWGQGELMRQHHPSLVEGDKVLLFDNGTEARGSRVMEVAPKTNKIGWTYKGKKPTDFFSIIRGGCQRLPGGNTLITDSEKGRVFEVTRGGEMVWEFYNPDMSLVHIILLRAPIYRMKRFPRSMFKELLAR